MDSSYFVCFEQLLTAAEAGPAQVAKLGAMGIVPFRINGAGSCVGDASVFAAAFAKLRELWPLRQAIRVTT